MKTILDEIVEKNRTHLDTSASRREYIAGLASVRNARRSFAKALRRDGFNVIAELKKASPSKGLIRGDFQPAVLAKTLGVNGAAALSVLTEPFYFQGALDYLPIVAAATDIPILRKDFIFDEIQIAEAEAYGADAVLLIAAMLDSARFKDLLQFAADKRLDALCEVHNQAELEMVLNAGAEIIGINCRDLKTFQIDRALTLKMMGEIPSNKIRVAESGIADGYEMAELRRAGADAFLIGETLMRQNEPGIMLKKLITEANEASD
ncbi:MAG: indole-3-glycerol phosphate synthase TrpC [Victivallaceae bacterium]|jgi:indole-3-glycerol phosphate synthase|nr:indole-3-glycerol phosphate synthase TrpC [Victivallaceae bacterium]MDD3116253.1 indole-3-glycerol phosphate synthase TrpC [Victivallaceae bacterium]MDD3702939.1 indole-3-glycerol phosphate synthase TrpC [Victivallaceae bacterium]MDD4317745.1 indole-3-glycerol phosphate synthase TrpC [Victivallaceae bacterium]MDD5663089.1 indole-3-glycerol phosphate synthase TrpC [Victivallaceae bacterium]